MADIEVENYKKSVIRAVERWVGKLKDIQKKREKLEDPDKGSPEIDKLIEKANMELRADLILLDPPEKGKADEKELLKLPAWMKEIIKAKGIPVAKGISIVPNVDFDLKTMKLKSFGVTVNF